MDKHTVVPRPEQQLKPAYNGYKLLLSQATKDPLAQASIQSAINYIKQTVNISRSPEQIAQCERNGQYLDQIKARLKGNQNKNADPLPGSKLAALAGVAV
jgi:phosphomannomutase